MFCMICDKLGVARPVCVQNVARQHADECFACKMWLGNMLMSALRLVVLAGVTSTNGQSAQKFSPPVVRRSYYSQSPTIEFASQPGAPAAKPQSFPGVHCQRMPQRILFPGVA